VLVKVLWRFVAIFVVFALHPRLPVDAAPVSVLLQHIYALKAGTECMTLAKS
jgi:hypothetical protein